MTTTDGRRRLASSSTLEVSAGLPVSLRDFSRFEAPPAFKAHESKTTQLVSEHQNDIVEHYAAATRPDQRKRKVI
ncbi:MAG: hypothetical protein L0Y58_11780, partial [Verrucomicrobia subdivision 3 bacterium]|nr:hypothetical protein [Limisphaerales bacterium]